MLDYKEEENTQNFAFWDIIFDWKGSADYVEANFEEFIRNIESPDAGEGLLKVEKDRVKEEFGVWGFVVSGLEV